MIAHVWLSSANRQFLLTEPASGTTTSGTLATTKWNDFDNLRWLGVKTSTDPVVAGVWQCVEAHVSLNSPGASNGEFNLWIDGNQVVSRSNLNWIGSYEDYGINAVMVSGYMNGGAPVVIERFIDSFVIATGRIGCDAPATRPLPPTGLKVN